MAGHDIIVIGGSAGGIEALSTLLAGLPPDLPAAVCVVLHQSAYSPNRHPDMFARVSSLPVVLAEQGMRLQRGTVYLSVPDMHMLVERSPTAELGTLRLVRGPKENRVRPAADPLFRTAALAFGRRVVGVVLSGALDDGSSGLWVVKDCGGVTVVQDPSDAVMGSMPTHAIEEVGADHVAPASEMGELLGRIAREGIEGHADGHAHRRAPAPVARAPLRQAGSALRRADVEREVAIAAIDEEAHGRSERYGVPSRFGCPDCGGVLWSASAPGEPLHFRCETGHSYGGATLAEAQSEAIEAALWAALRALEDKVELARLRAGLARERGFEDQARELREQLQGAQQHGASIRALLRLEYPGPGASGRTPARGHDVERPVTPASADWPVHDDRRR